MMKLFRFITLLLSAVACAAVVRGGIKTEDSYDTEVKDDELERALTLSSYAGYFSKGKKGGKNYSPAYSSPVLAPSTGCTSPTCGNAPVASVPTCGSEGCPPNPSCTGAGCPGGVKGKGYGKGSGKGYGGKKGDYGGKKGGYGGKKGGYGKGSNAGKGAVCPGGNCTNGGGDGGSCGCRVDQVELDFVMLPPNATVLVSPDLGSSTIGTVFIYNDALFDMELTALPGTFIAGLCHRTQLTQNAGGENTLVGGGYCHFTFTVSDGTTSVTFNAAGEVFDVLGGTLALTGGTGELTGTYGEVEIVPVYETTTQVDFFTEASLYVGSASLFVPLF